MEKINHVAKSPRTPCVTRYFDEVFRRKKVEEIESNLTSIAEVSRTYQVSKTTLHR